MNPKPEGTGSRVCWFVGASYGGTNDQTGRFYKEKIWEHASSKYREDVKSMRVGDRIAIKAAYTRKRELPFDNRGKTVSVMAVKAIGVITENPGDGQRVKVDWTPFEHPREWYFYTHRGIVWRVLPGNWYADSLIAFAFDGEPQNLVRFRNDPYWKERFGDRDVDKGRFQWTNFYEAMADKLITFKDDRSPIITALYDIASRIEGLSYLQDQYSDGTSGPFRDICPFTILGIFNRGITDDNRKIIATELATFLGIEEDVPETFEGISTLNNQKSWFFSFEKNRQPDDIDTLWEIFSKAIEFSDSDDPETRESFITAYDNATFRRGVGWNLTMGLYWIRPWAFPSLDSQSRTYIDKKLRIQIGNKGPSRRCNATEYLALLDTLDTRFQEDAYPVHSFPELSLAAFFYEDTSSVDVLELDRRKGWQDALTQCIQSHCKKIGQTRFSYQEILQYLAEFARMFPDNNSLEATISRQLQILRDRGSVEFIDNKGNYEWLGAELSETESLEEDEGVPDTEIVATPIDPYSVDDILKEGCFLEQKQLEEMLERLRTKRNLILQGPPGTGKTWLAKRLAFALIGQRSDSKVRALQFHPNLSYEDFVRGWRPSGEGKLSLVDGPFLEMITAASKDPATGHVVVIEEINRGNPAQIFGEMLTLLEVDKRTPNEALELCYRRKEGERVFIPKNLFVIGTMNIADRSLALVDLALRRRFAFIDLKPILGKKWHNWVHSKCGIEPEILTEIEKRMLSLNEEIKADISLGHQFQIGHSYVTPPSEIPIKDAREWFKQVVITEIGPLLDEYWFDALDKARNARSRLTVGF